MANRNETRALVLGGGGVAGIAWEMGVLAALLGNGVALNDAEAVIGTSAGAVVGTLLRSGMLRRVLEAQLRGEDPAETVAEQGELSHFSTEQFLNMTADAARGPGGEKAARARMGRGALAAGLQPSEEAWVRTIRRLLPVQDWPAGPLLITAVNADDGAFTVFDAASGVELAPAVAASCSVPGAWPPVHISGVPYMDGGMRSATNADLAGEYDKVLVLSCEPEAPDSPFGPTLFRALEQMQGRTNAFLIEADETSRAAFGANVLLQSTRRPSALAGAEQGRRMADAVKAFWSG